MKLFGNNRKSLAYHSDAQLKEALSARKTEAFDFVFDRYGPLLKKNIENAFQVQPANAEKAFKKRCSELQNHLLANNCAKLNLYNPEDSAFETWLAVVSLSFFKKTFCDENTVLANQYRNGGDGITYQRFKTDFEEKIRLTGVKDHEIIVENAKDLAHNLYVHLFEDNCRRLNTYDPSKKSFDAWFKTVLRNFSIDQYKKNQKKEEEVIDSGGFVRIDDQIPPAWESSVITIEDEEKKALLQELRELLDTLEPPRYREVLIALYFEGEKYEDIAQRLEVTVDNLYNIAKRALDRFRDRCKDQGIIK